MKEQTRENMLAGLGCLIWILAFALLGFVFFGTSIINNKLEDKYCKDRAIYQEELSVYEEELEAYWKHQRAVDEYQTNNAVLCDLDLSAWQSGGGGIGNELYYYFEINGYEVEDGGYVAIPLGRSVKFYGEAIEDDTLPDVGRASYSCSFDINDLKSGYWIELYPSAHETRGPDAGNTAHFTLRFEFEAVEEFSTTMNMSCPISPQEPKLLQINFWQSFNFPLWINALR
jgi:hypothetical protein